MNQLTKQARDELERLENKSLKGKYLRILDACADVKLDSYRQIKRGPRDKPKVHKVIDVPPETKQLHQEITAIKLLVQAVDLQEGDIVEAPGKTQTLQYIVYTGSLCAARLPDRSLHYPKFPWTYWSECVPVDTYHGVWINFSGMALRVSELSGICFEVDKDFTMSLKTNWPPILSPVIAAALTGPEARPVPTLRDVTTLHACPIERAHGEMTAWDLTYNALLLANKDIEIPITPDYGIVPLRMFAALTFTEFANRQINELTEGAASIVRYLEREWDPLPVPLRMLILSFL